MRFKKKAEQAEAIGADCDQNRVSKLAEQALFVADRRRFHLVLLEVVHGDQQPLLEDAGLGQAADDVEDVQLEVVAEKALKKEGGQNGAARARHVHVGDIAVEVAQHVAVVHDDEVLVEAVEAAPTAVAQVDEVAELEPLDAVESAPEVVVVGRRRQEVLELGRDALVARPHPDALDDVGDPYRIGA